MSAPAIIFRIVTIFQRISFYSQSHISRYILQLAYKTNIFFRTYTGSRHDPDRENCDRDLDLDQIWDRDRSFAISDRDRDPFTYC